MSMIKPDTYRKYIIDATKIWWTCFVNIGLKSVRYLNLINIIYVWGIKGNLKSVTCRYRLQLMLVDYFACGHFPKKYIIQIINKKEKKKCKFYLVYKQVEKTML